MVKNNEVKLFSFSFDKCTVTASSSKMAIIERILKVALFLVYSCCLREIRNRLILIKVRSMKL